MESSNQNNLEKSKYVFLHLSCHFRSSVEVKASDFLKCLAGFNFSVEVEGRSQQNAIINTKSNCMSHIFGIS